MKIGSMFSGIGGLDLAASAAFRAKVEWSIEENPHCCEVLRRHFDFQVIREDVQKVDPNTLPKVDILTGGWPCSNLSIAGDRTGLDGEKSRLYLECLRFAEALRPTGVVFENGPGVLKYQKRIEKDLHKLGYGVGFVRIAAADVGAPQWRKRVFIVGKQGEHHRGIINEFSSIPDGFWPTAVASGDRIAMFKQGGEPLGRAVRWPTPNARDSKDCGPTQGNRKSPNLGTIVHQEADGRLSGRLSPDWVECLMGFPVGWTRPEGDCQSFMAHVRTTSPKFPMSRGKEQFHWEPSRLVQGNRVMGRPARLRALGNAVVPSQGYAAILEAITVFSGKSPLLC